MEKFPAFPTIQTRRNSRANLSHLLACGIITMGLWSTNAWAATGGELDLLTGKTDLTAAASYSQMTTPTTTSDIVFSDITTYGTLSGASSTGTNLSIASLNDLDTTQTVVIAGNGSASTESLIINGNSTNGGTAGSDSVVGSASGDLIYLANNTNLTIQNGSHTLNVVLPNTSAMTGAANSTSIFDVGTGSTLTIKSVIQTTGAQLVLNGGGTVTLSGANTFGGGSNRAVTTSATGTLNINNASALGNATNTLILNAGTTIDNTSGVAIVVTNTNAVKVNGSFTFTGTNDLSLAGAVTLATSSSSRTITTTGGTLTLNGIVSGAGTGLTKAGSGTLLLAGANTYTGGTTINAGTLTVTNTTSSATASGTGTGPVALGATSGTTLATLSSGAGASGIITGTLTAGSTATARIAPGGVGTVGMLTLGNVSAATGATFAYDLGATSGGTSSDQITLGTLTGPTTGTGGLVFNFNNVGAVANTTYTLANYTTSTNLEVADFSATGGVMGTFSLNPNTTTGMEVDFFVTSVTPVPEPSTWVGASLVLVVAAWNQRKRLGSFCAAIWS